MAPLAVVDFETTGVMPERHDRVVEVGVVLLNPSGQVEWEWTTLVNPKRDIGASHIHGITAADVIDAPEFHEISDTLLEAVRGRAVVAHNASFDMRFLHHELARAQYPIRERPAALCSMKWAGRLVGPAKLSHCCEALGIELDGAHAALNDARATAQLIAFLSSNASETAEWQEDVDRALRFAWPSARVARQSPPSVLRSAEPVAADAWLKRILADTWVPGSPENEASYLLVLDAALLDRNISVTEGQQLVDVARDGGLSAERVMELHRSHLDFLAVEAWSDGVLTDDERTDLLRVADSLGLAANAVDEALERAKTAEPAGEHLGDGVPFLRAGDRVVFTGEMSRSREVWVEDIVGAGLASGGVTKSTRVLVTADPDSMSGKAAKARSYGIPVIDEPAFERMFNEYLDAQ